MESQNNVRTIQKIGELNLRITKEPKPLDNHGRTLVHKITGNYYAPKDAIGNIYHDEVILGSYRTTTYWTW